MFKVYKWLGYYLLRPYKRFEHLLKYLAIYFAKLNKLHKNRKERLNRKSEKLTWSPGERSPPSPAGPQGQGCLLPRPAHPSCSVECHRASRASRHATCLPGASPASLSHPGDAHECHDSILPLQSLLLFLLHSFRHRPQLHRSAPAWTTWPPCPRAQASKSTVLLVLDFIFKQKLEP